MLFLFLLLSKFLQRVDVVAEGCGQESSLEGIYIPSAVKKPLTGIQSEASKT